MIIFYGFKGNMQYPSSTRRRSWYEVRMLGHRQSWSSAKLLLSKGLSTITERKDGSSVEGDKVLASRQMRRIIPTVHESSFQSEMDTLDIFCQGTRLIWFVDDSNLLDCRRISNRISMDKVGVCKVTMQHQYYIEVIHC